MKLMRSGLVAAVLAAGSLAMAAPAAAHGRRGGDDAAIAIGAGVVGLALGAAIASSNNDRDVYVNYRSPGYYPPPYGGYYAPTYPVYRAYPAYRPYRGWRGYDPRYEQYRRWREHERWEHRGYRRGW